MFYFDERLHSSVVPEVEGNSPVQLVFNRYDDLELEKKDIYIYIYI
jgi:hypothetical protein